MSTEQHDRLIEKLEEEVLKLRKRMHEATNDAAAERLASQLFRKEMQLTLEQQNKDLSEIKHGLVGDHNREGVLTKVDRLEQSEKFRARWFWIFATAAGTAIVSTAVAAAFIVIKHV